MPEEIVRTLGYKTFTEAKISTEKQLYLQNYTQRIRLLFCVDSLKWFLLLPIKFYIVSKIAHILLLNVSRNFLFSYNYQIQCTIKKVNFN